ncbi:MAG: peptidoglycan-binding protein [Rhodobacteraceae bacterium]|nr:peptidoglycan-binding protein [Paracoccaceae bacterium]
MRTKWVLTSHAACGIIFTIAGSEALAQQCENATARCRSNIDTSCLSDDARVGAAAIAINPDQNSERCAGQFEQYRACLRQVLQECGGTGAATQPATAPAAAASRGDCSPDTEQRLWDTVKDSNDPEELAIFAETCPASPFALIAKRRIAASSTGGGQAPVSQTPSVSAGPGAPTAAASQEAVQPQFIGRVEYAEAQTELRRLGLYHSSIDGDWGPGSQRAMQAFQQKNDLLADGELTSATLSALKQAPTPPPSQRTANSGYSGLYKGSWHNPSLGMSGWSQYKVHNYNFSTGAMQGEMVMESDGVIYSGVVSGTVIPGKGGKARAQVHGADGTGWDIQLTYSPASTYDLMTGSYYSVQMGSLLPIPQSGTFQTRRVQ